MLIILSSLLVCILVLVGVLLAFSPGKPVPFLDVNGSPAVGSISEKVFVQIGGVKQGMFIKSKDVKNPVLLYLHGGMPEYFLTRKYPTGLENYFTVVWWEQRGSGLSCTLAKDYFEKLQAPVKGFYTFEKSAHSPLFEEPEKLRHILQEDVLAGMSNLADTI